MVSDWVPPLSGELTFLTILSFIRDPFNAMGGTQDDISGVGRKRQQPQEGKSEASSVPISATREHAFPHRKEFQRKLSNKVKTKLFADSEEGEEKGGG